MAHFGVGFLNHLSVQVSECQTPWGWTRHVRVTRHDGGEGITWDELQAVKNEYLGPDAQAVEIYPPQHRLVDEVNMRHLWEIPDDMLRIGLNR